MSTATVTKLPVFPVSTLRPGLLVSLNTSIRGNISYRTEDVEREHLTSAGEQVARWETERTIADPKEYAAAVKVRSKVRSLIRGVCAQSAFGMLCPEDNADKLAEAVSAARVLAEEFNSTAKLTRVNVAILTGRIAQDDVEAVRAISDELRGLMTDMQNGLASMDVQAVRDACTKARSVGMMLSDDAKERVQEAIEVARKAARKIAAAGDEVAVEIDKQAIAAIDRQRTSFLDLDDDDTAAQINVVADVRSIDLEDE